MAWDPPLAEVQVAEEEGLLEEGMGRLVNWVTRTWV